jgi:hypothetical protein
MTGRLCCFGQLAAPGLRYLPGFRHHPGGARVAVLRGQAINLSEASMARCVAIALIALLCATAQMPAHAHTKKGPFTAEPSWQIQRIGVPTLSADGQTVIAPVTRFAMDEDKSYVDLWIWNAEGIRGVHAEQDRFVLNTIVAAVAD